MALPDSPQLLNDLMKMSHEAMAQDLEDAAFWLPYKAMVEFKMIQPKPSFMGFQVNLDARLAADEIKMTSAHLPNGYTITYRQPAFVSERPPAERYKGNPLFGKF